MLETIVRAIFGDPSEKQLKLYEKDLLRVKEFEQKFQTEILSVEKIREKMASIRTRFE